jgi:hypothetical protein
MAGWISRRHEVRGKAIGISSLLQISSRLRFGPHVA